MDTRRTNPVHQVGPAALGGVIRSATDAYAVVANLARCKEERFWALAMGKGASLLGARELARGTPSLGPVSPRELFQYLMDVGAKYAILAHNHPSESCLPCEEDVRQTRQLVRLGRALELRIVDHIIVGQDGFFSFREARLVFRRRGWWE